MGIFGSGQTEQQRFYARPPQTVFEALLNSLHDSRYTVTSADNISLSATINSPMSGFTWGEKLTANCLPAEGGTTLVISAASKVGGSFAQASRNTSVINQVFDLVSQQLRLAQQK